MRKLLLAGCVTLVLTTTAHADGRSRMFLEGTAHAIAAKCPGMKVNHDPKLYRGWTRRGTRQEFAEGMRFIAEVWGKNIIADDDTSAVDCHNVCDTRSGTCNFVKEGK